MKKLLLLLTVTLLISCGSKVEIPPAHVGKILGKNGYAPDTLPPSKIRLAACLSFCDKLVLLEASDAGLSETMTLFMPKDKLNIKIDIRGTMSVPSDKKNVDSLFDRLPAKPTSNSVVSIITASQVYSTYGQQALRGIVRSELVKYKISDILQNRDTIGQKIHFSITEKMKATNIPLNLSRFELADIQPPKVIVKAQEAAKEREIAVQQAEADANVKLVEANLALKIAKKDRLVEKEKALAIAEQNHIAAKSITPQLLMYRRLEVSQAVLTAFAKSGNKNIILLPADMSATKSIVDGAAFAKILGREVAQK